MVKMFNNSSLVVNSNVVIHLLSQKINEYTQKAEHRIPVTINVMQKIIRRT